MVESEGCGGIGTGLKGQLAEVEELDDEGFSAVRAAVDVSGAGVEERCGRLVWSTN